MLTEPPNLKKEISNCLLEQYGVKAKEIVFLPLGVDFDSVMYKITGDNGSSYFLKLRKNNFTESSTLIPHFLVEEGFKNVISPILTNSTKTYYINGEYYFVLYPFIDSAESKEGHLSETHKIELGELIKKLHSVIIPPEIQKLIHAYKLSSDWRKRLKDIIDKILNETFEDFVSVELKVFIKQNFDQILNLINELETLSSQMKLNQSEFVLCHADLHFWNLLVDKNNQLYLIDWDTLIFAPKERDLMFVGGKTDALWNNSKEIELFYKGYGQTEINHTLIKYFRIERIIEDLASIAESICFTEMGEEDKKRIFKFFTENFKPGNTIDVTLKQNR